MSNRRWAAAALVLAALGWAGTAAAAQEAGNGEARSVPEVSIGPGASPVDEGTPATFALTRSGATTDALTVAVSVSATGSVLDGAPATTVSFAIGDSDATLSVATDDDAVVEDPSMVTVAIRDDPAYVVRADAAQATVTVQDDDVADFSASLDAATIAEAGAEESTVTVSIGNGVVFEATQLIDVALSGDATAGSDFRFEDARGRIFTKPYALQLPAGHSAVTGVLTAVDDTRDDDAETVTIAASHKGSAIGDPLTVSIADDDDPAPSLALESLSVTSSDPGRRPMYPAFDPETLHYGVGCSFRDSETGATDVEYDTMTVRFSVPEAQAATTRAAVNAEQAPRRDAEVVLTGLDGESDIDITLSDAAGQSRTYSVHCLDDDFAELEVQTEPGAWDGLIMAAIPQTGESRNYRWTYLTVMDTNGVPRFRRRVDTWVSHFKPVQAVDYPYAYLLRPNDQSMSRVIFLDGDLAEGPSVWSAIADQNLDAHDFTAVPDGRGAVQYYRWSYCDARPYDPTPQTAGNSIIQIVPTGGPHTGANVFTWNSCHYMAIEDCSQHRDFPGNYAHINSTQYVDGDFVMSMRGCSKVLMIDGDTGDVLWRVGLTNRSAEDWAANEATKGPAPLRIVGDPLGEFCAQHSAKVVGNGNLILYDNGSHCVRTPVRDGQGTRLGTRPDGRSAAEDGGLAYSRAVEYWLDVDAGAATYRGEHALRREDGELAFTDTTGSVEVLDNGNWLIGWGRGGNYDQDPLTSPAADQTITEFDPYSGQELLNIELTLRSGRRIAVRPYPLRHDEWRIDPDPLTAQFAADSEHTAGFFARMSDRPQVVVAFNQPVADFEADTPSIAVSGATVASVGALVAPGEPANAYLLTLAPDGETPVTVRLVTGGACDDGGICTTDGSSLSTVPASHRIRFNAPPVVEGDTVFDVDENTVAVGTLRARDRDTASSGLVWSVPSDAPGADGAEFELSAGGVLTLVEGKDFEAPDDADGDGVYEVRVQVSDGDSAAFALLEVTIVDVDEPAVVSFAAAGGVTANGSALGVDENHDGTLAAFSASDPENKAGLTYTWSLGGRDRGDFAITGAGVLSFAAVPDYERPADSGGDNVYEVTVSALDSDDMLGGVAVTVTVDPVNERPAIVGDAEASVEEGGALSVGTYRASDPEGALVAWQPLAGADWDRFEFTASNGRLVFTAAPDFEDAADSGGNNVYDVALSVSAGGHTAAFDVAVAVTNKDEIGVLGFSSPRPQAGADYTATLSDADGVVSATWTWERSTSRSGPWTAVSGAAGGAATSVYTPVGGDVGYFLRAAAAYTDGHGPNKSRSLVSASSVKAAPGSNVAPSFEDRAPTRRVAENARAGAAVGAPVEATDADSGDVVTYELSGSDLFTIDNSSGQISVVAGDSLDHETAPSHSVTVTASDTTNASDTVTVTIEVTDVNEPPDAVADTGRASEDGDVTIDVLANDSDPEDDPSALTLTVATGPRRGSATVNEPAGPGERPTITYTPRGDYHGADIFTYEVRDAGSPSRSSTATVSVEVEAVNDPPTFASPATTRSVSASADPGDGVGAPVTATDVDEGDTLTYSLSGTEARFFAIGPRSGQITVGDGVTFDIATKDTYTVTVAADDTSLDRATVDVTITVTSEPTTPPITGGGGGGGGGGPAAVVGIDGASYAAVGTEAVFAAAVSDETRISALRWAVIGPDGFTATSSAPRLAFAAPAGGAYTVSVTVEDIAGRTLTGRVSLTVFGDITDHQFLNEIIWLAEEGITRGCDAHSYCPTNPVTRAHMASFLARALNLQEASERAGFTDVDAPSVHAANIEALLAAHITAGCAQQPLRYCPNSAVTRAQMASFLARALNLQAPPQRAGFTDVDATSVHAANIEALLAARITAGCAQQPLQYCPNRPITRAQMAAFLYRARDLITAARASAGT